MDDDDAEPDDDEFDDGPDEFDSSDEEPTVPCPYCHREILEDSPRCPHCERYISDEDRPRQRKSWLIIVGSVVSLYVVYRWIAG